MSYTNIFGGYNINTAFPSYQSFTFDSDLQLTWASSFVDNSNVTAQTNDLNATEALLTVTLADAKLISVGQTIQFNNVGANPVIIKNFLGSEIVEIPPTDNNQIILYLQDNTTPGGIWGITHLGAGTSSADASILAGLGTIALNSQINTNFPGKTINANYQVLSSDRASILVWTGGSGTITLPIQQTGFYIAVNNEGSGAIVIETPDATTIDGQNSFSINPSESSYFIGVETNWNTLGFGVESFFQVNVLAPLDLSGVGASLTLTNQQASRLVQQYVGLLTQDVTVYYPAAAGQWYIWNNTTGPHNVIAQLSGPTGNPITIPQGEKVILYSDGISMYNTPTIATSAVFNDGTVGAPGISFISDTSTGFYKLPNGVVGYSSQGTGSLLFGGAASGIGFGIRSALPGVYWNIPNTHYVGLKAPVGLVDDLIFTLPEEEATVDQQIIYATIGGGGQTNLHLTTAAYPVFVPVNNLLYAYAEDKVRGLDTANNGVLITDPTGVPSIGTTLPTAVQNNITSVGIVTSGTVRVTAGGTGLNTTTAYGVICGGTTSTGSLQNAGTGTLGRVLVSNGPSALPTWQAGVSAASVVEMKAASSITTYTSPGRQQYHPSACAFWVDFDGTPTGNIEAFYNVSSVTRNSTGDYTIDFANNFSSNSYVVIINVGANSVPGSTSISTLVTTQNTNSIDILTFIGAGVLHDFRDVYVIGFGQLA